MAGVNKAIIVGNLGNDPETRYTQDQKAVTNISVATSKKWKDKLTGKENESTEWHRVVFFNRLAEIAGEYLKKGSKVYVEGSLRTNKWQDKDGVDRYTTEIIANELQMLDSRGGAGDFSQSSSSGANAPKSGSSSSPQVTHADNSFDSFDDDIPF